MNRTWDAIDEQAAREGSAKTRHIQLQGYKGYGRRVFNTHQMGRTRPINPPSGSRLHERREDAA
jgi:hypothetical protein